MNQLLIDKININSLINLPNELIKLIGYQLKSSNSFINSIHNLISLSLVNKKFYQILRNPEYLINFRLLNFDKYYQIVKIPIISHLGIIETYTFAICRDCGELTNIYNLDTIPCFNCDWICDNCKLRICYKYIYKKKNGIYYNGLCQLCYNTDIICDNILHVEI